MVSGKSETPFLMSATVMKKATQNTALPKMKRILSPKGLFKKTEKYYFGIVAVCNTVTLFHYTGTEKRSNRNCSFCRCDKNPSLSAIGRGDGTCKERRDGIARAKPERHIISLYSYGEKKESDGKGRNGKKEQPKLLLLPLRQKLVAFRYWSR